MVPPFSTWIGLNAYKYFKFNNKQIQQQKLSIRSILRKAWGKSSQILLILKRVQLMLLKMSGGLVHLCVDGQKLYGDTKTKDSYQDCIWEHLLLDNEFTKYEEIIFGKLKNEIQSTLQTIKTKTC